LLLQTKHRRSDELLLVGLAFPKDRCEFPGEFVWDADLLQDLAELPN